jgi:hypothetical protein
MFLGKSGGPLGSAKISIREPQKDSTGELYIPIHYDFTNGRGPSLDENSALVKPFRNILKDGRPPDEISFVFHQESENDYFVLGSFVKTIGNRILFFPGLRFSKIVHTPTGIDLTNQESHNIDHFTLDENMNRWHVTLVQKSDLDTRYPSLKTKKVNNNSFFWFLMAVRDPTMLEVMPKTQEYMLKGPPADMKRRFENLTKSVEAKHFQVTCVKSPSLPSFLNFEIYTSSGGELNPPRDVFVIPSPISASSRNIQQIHSRVHDFSLDQSSSISIRVYKIIGSLKYDGIYFPGGFW